jgi:hypothetical protein
METYTTLVNNTNDVPVSLKLTLGQIKILHNACVDVLKDYPEMLGYSEVRTKLNEIILDVEKKLLAD